MFGSGSFFSDVALYFRFGELGSFYISTDAYESEVGILHSSAYSYAYVGI